MPAITTGPNQIWTIDFKGQFRTGNGVYCYPLTIIDHFSRYLLRCHGLFSVEDARRAIFRYIETWYNRKRRHSTLGYVSPAAYEMLLQEAA